MKVLSISLNCFNFSRTVSHRVRKFFPMSFYLWNNDFGQLPHLYICNNIIPLLPVTWITCDLLLCANTDPRSGDVTIHKIQNNKVVIITILWKLHIYIYYMYVRMYMNIHILKCLCIWSEVWSTVGFIASPSFSCGRQLFSNTGIYLADYVSTDCGWKDHRDSLFQDCTTHIVKFCCYIEHIYVYALDCFVFVIYYDY